METIYHCTKWKRYIIAQNGNDISLHKMKTIYHCTKWKRYIIAQNGNDISLHKMKTIYHCTKWKRYIIAQNGNDISLHKMETIYHCTKWKLYIIAQRKNNNKIWERWTNIITKGNSKEMQMLFIMSSKRRYCWQFIVNIRSRIMTNSSKTFKISILNINVLTLSIQSGKYFENYKHLSSSQIRRLNHTLYRHESDYLLTMIELDVCLKHIQ